MSSKKIVIIISVIFTLALFTLYTMYSFRQSIKVKPLPVYGQVYDFELVDERGQPFSLKNLTGRVWIANFFFTTCSDICPVMSKNMAALHRSFELVDDVTLVSITVNPEFDSPEILQKYADKYNANTSKWRFLTGSRATIKALAVKSFKLGDIKEPVFHSAQFALVDRHGMIRGYYDGVQAGEVSDIFKDASRLIKEK